MIVLALMLSLGMIHTTHAVCVDADLDGFNVTIPPDSCGPTDCNDNNASILPPISPYLVFDDIVLCNGSYNIATPSGLRALDVLSSNASIICNGTFMNGTGGGGGTGIYVSQFDNLTVRGCTFFNVSVGIEMIDSLEHLIENNTFLMLSGQGLKLTNVNDSTFINNTINTTVPGDAKILDTSGIGVNNVVVYQNNNGSINWTLDNISESSVLLGLGLNPIIRNNFVQGNFTGSLNSTATIRLFTVAGAILNKVVLRNDQFCTSVVCSRVIRIDGGENYLFNVTQFSNYSLANDTFEPQVTFLSPTAGQTITDTTPLLRATITELGVGLVPTQLNFTIDNTVTYRNPLTLTCIPSIINMSLTVCSVTSPSLAVGIHTFNVSALDSAGNIGREGITFTIAQEVTGNADSGGGNDPDEPEEAEEEPTPEPIEEPITEPIEEPQQVVDTPEDTQSSDQSTDGSESDPDGTEFDDDGMLTVKQKDTQFSIRAIRIGDLTLYEDGILINDLIVHSDESIQILISIVNTGVTPLDALEVHARNLPEGVTLEAENDLTAILLPGEEGMLQAVIKTENVESPFTFSLYIVSKQTALRLSLDAIVEHSDITFFLREKIIRETKAIVQVMYPILIFLTLPIILLFLFNISTYANEEMVRFLAEKDQVHHYSKLYVLPATKQRYQFWNLSQINLTHHELQERNYLQQKYSIDEETAALIIHANKRFVPRILTLTQLSYNLRKRYHHIFFISAVKSQSEGQLVEYIRSQKQKGFTNHEIRTALLDAGWNRELVYTHLDPYYDLRMYVRYQRKQGVSPIELKTKLLSAGWKEEEIQKHLI